MVLGLFWKVEIVFNFAINETSKKNFEKVDEIGYKHTLTM